MLATEPRSKFHLFIQYNEDNLLKSFVFRRQESWRILIPGQLPGLITVTFRKRGPISSEMGSRDSLISCRRLKYHMFS